MEAEQRRKLRASLNLYSQWALPLVLPTTPIVWGWHIDCKIAHLEAVARTEISTLLINEPPRHLKSTMTSILFCGWLLARRSSTKMLTGSYAMPLATRDATRMRRLITHPVHQRMFPDIVLERDQNEKTRYDLATLTSPETGEVVGGGARYCFATGAMTTGEGGDILIWDDPHKASDM